MTSEPNGGEIDVARAGVERCAQTILSFFCIFVLVNAYFVLVLASVADEDLLRRSSVRLPLFGVSVEIRFVAAIFPAIILLLMVFLQLLIGTFAERIGSFERAVAPLDEQERQRRMAQLSGSLFASWVWVNQEGKPRHWSRKFALAFVVSAFPLVFVFTLHQTALALHDPYVTMANRLAWVFTLAALWIWPKTFGTGYRAENNPAIRTLRTRLRNWLGVGLGIAATLALSYVAFLVLVIPDERLDRLGARYGLVPDGIRAMFSLPGKQNLCVTDKTLVEEGPPPELQAAYHMQGDGVDAAWRDHARGLDLRRRDLRYASLLNVNLVNADLRNADLRGALLDMTNLEGADLRGAKLDFASLYRAQLRGANLEGASVRYAELSEADLSECRLVDTTLTGAMLSGAILTDARFNSATDLRLAFLRCEGLRGINFSRAQLQGADLRGVDLTAARLVGCHLQAANLSRAELRFADLTDADLRGAELTAAQLQGANLHRASLQGTRLGSASLRGAFLRGSYLAAGNFTGCDLRLVDLRDAVSDPKTVREYQDSWPEVRTRIAEVNEQPPFLSHNLPRLCRHEAERNVAFCRERMEAAIERWDAAVARLKDHPTPVFERALTITGSDVADEDQKRVDGTIHPKTEPFADLGEPLTYAEYEPAVVAYLARLAGEKPVTANALAKRALNIVDFSSHQKTIDESLGVALCHAILTAQAGSTLEMDPDLIARIREAILPVAED